jgi:uncharacterized membrane protein YhhN
LRIYNKLILTIALVFGIIDASLAAASQENIEIYFVANAIAFLVITLLYTYLNPRARGALTAVGSVIFAAFLVIVVIKIVDILKQGSIS